MKCSSHHSQSKAHSHGYLSAHCYSPPAPPCCTSFPSGEAIKRPWIPQLPLFLELPPWSHDLIRFSRKKPNIQNTQNEWQLQATTASLNILCKPPLLLEAGKSFLKQRTQPSINKYLRMAINGWTEQAIEMLRLSTVSAVHTTSGGSAAGLSDRHKLPTRQAEAGLPGLAGFWQNTSLCFCYTQMLTFICKECKLSIPDVESS